MFEALDAAEAAIGPALEAEDFAAAMTALSDLRAPIDAFFEDDRGSRADGPAQPALPAASHPRRDEPRRDLLGRRGRLKVSVGARGAAGLCCAAMKTGPDQPENARDVIDLAAGDAVGADRFGRRAAKLAR